MTTTKRPFVINTARQSGKSYLNNWHKMFQAYKEMNIPVTDLLLSEGTVYGARYYTVEPKGGNWNIMEDWCTATFGNTGSNMWGDNKAPNPAERWYMNNSKFWFREEKDRTMFVLKWR